MESIRERASYLYHINDNKALFKLAEDNWPRNVEDGLPEGICEVCRHAFIRSHEMNLIDQHLWRARALVAAVIEGAWDTAAGLLFQPFFVAVDVAVKQEQYNWGGGFDQARLILKEIKRLVPEGAPRYGLFCRLYSEKLAFSYLKEGAGDGRPTFAGMPALKRAEQEYERALTLVGEDDRGELKVRGGLALAGYLLLADKSDEAITTEKAPFLEETKAILSSAKDKGYDDVVRWATPNVGVMERGEFEGWVPYDVA